VSGVGEGAFWLLVDKIGLGSGRLPTLGLTAMESNPTEGEAWYSGCVPTTCFGVVHPPSTSSRARGTWGRNYLLNPRVWTCRDWLPKGQADANEARTALDRPTIHELANAAAQRLRSQEENDHEPHPEMALDSPRSTTSALASPGSPASRVRRGESWDRPVDTCAERRRVHRRSSWCTSL
jgi:hypothetical protein